MAATEFSPGFRINALDVAVLIACATGATFAAQVEWWMGLIIAFAAVHFFLFCNVFRVQRPFELGWAILFVSLAASTIALRIPGWGVTVTASSVATLAIVAMEMRKLSYHGILWQRINPELKQWWLARGAELSQNKLDFDEQIRPIVVPDAAYRTIRACGVILALAICASVLIGGPVMLLVGVIPYWISIKLFVPRAAG
jgi:hypothetical protein